MKILTEMDVWKILHNLLRESPKETMNINRPM